MDITLHQVQGVRMQGFRCLNEVLAVEMQSVQPIVWQGKRGEQDAYGLQRKPGCGRRLRLAIAT